MSRGPGLGLVQGLDQSPVQRAAGVLYGGDPLPWTNRQNNIHTRRKTLPSPLRWRALIIIHTLSKTLKWNKKWYQDRKELHGYSPDLSCNGNILNEYFTPVHDSAKSYTFCSTRLKECSRVTKFRSSPKFAPILFCIREQIFGGNGSANHSDW